jgi:histidine triad (HIT) family protein
MSSIFTKIIQGKLPAYKVAEDNKNLAFLDISPIAKGHVLVVPKKEVDYLFDMEDIDYLALQSFTKKVALGLKKAIPCKKVGSMVLGLEVPHAHIHLVPMQTETDLLNFSKKLTCSEKELKEIQKKVKKEIVCQ